VPFSYQPSVLLLGLLAAGLWKVATRRDALRRQEARSVWILGLASGCVLYPSALGLGHFDVYVWGWGAGPLLAAVTLVAIGAAASGNRAAWPLVAAVLLWNAGIFESTNLWDYLVDPVLFVAALFAIWKRVEPPVEPSGSTAT
jgi:hypothetical protein